MDRESIIFWICGVLIIIGLIFGLVKCQASKVNSHDIEKWNPSISFITINDMPCLEVYSHSGYSGYYGITCDWDKWDGTTEVRINE